MSAYLTQSSYPDEVGVAGVSTEWLGGFGGSTQIAISATSPRISPDRTHSPRKIPHARPTMSPIVRFLRASGTASGSELIAPHFHAATRIPKKRRPLGADPFNRTRSGV